MWEWVEHTAEIELRVEAPSWEAVFAEATAALGELLGEGAQGEPAEHEVRVAARDGPALLAQYLEELVFLAETRGFVPERLTDVELADDALRATVAGLTDEPPPLVKAITYHRLALEPRGDGWAATVVLDV